MGSLDRNPLPEAPPFFNVYHSALSGGLEVLKNGCARFGTAITLRKHPEARLPSEYALVYALVDLATSTESIRGAILPPVLYFVLGPVLTLNHRDGAVAIPDFGGWRFMHLFSFDALLPDGE